MESARDEYDTELDVPARREFQLRPARSLISPVYFRSLDSTYLSRSVWRHKLVSYSYIYFSRSSKELYGFVVVRFLRNSILEIKYI